MAIHSANDFLNLAQRAKQSAQNPKDIIIGLGQSRLGSTDAWHIASALKSGECPNHLRILLASNNIGAEGALFIAGALDSVTCPTHLHIDLSENGIGTEGAKYIASNIRLVSRYRNLFINLSSNNILDEGAKHFASSLASGQCHANISLSLAKNNISVQGAEYIANAIKSGNYPENLTIYLNFNNLTDVGAQHIANAFIQTKIKEGLKLFFDKEINEKIQEILAEAVEQVVDDASATETMFSQAGNAVAALSVLFPEKIAELKESHLEEIERVITAPVENEKHILKSIRAVTSIVRLFPNEKHWNENPLEILYAKYFLLKLSKSRKSDLSNPENVIKLEDLFSEFHARAKELHFPKTYHWASLFENFAESFHKIPKDAPDHQNKLLRFKKDQVLEEMITKTKVISHHASIN